jgi:MYXO-CTERM domain-containing protein
MKNLSMQSLWGFVRKIALPFATIATVLVVLLGAPSASFACKCAPPPEAAEALAQSTAVFEAQVTQLNTTSDELEVSLRVTRAWKGVDTETIRVRTRKDTAACGVEFAMGQVWLVYANQTTEQDSAIALQVLRCGRSRLAAEAGDDFTVLGLGVVPVAPREPAPAAVDAAAPSAAKPNQPQALEPAANGCASCSLGQTRRANPAVGLIVLASLLVIRKQRRRKSPLDTSN